MSGTPSWRCWTTSRISFGARHRHVIDGIVTYAAFTVVSSVACALGMDLYMALTLSAAGAALWLVMGRVPPRGHHVTRLAPYLVVAAALLLAWLAGEGLAVTWQLLQPPADSSTMSVGVWAITYECLLAPVLEELVFRGRMLDDGQGPVAVVLSTALFCAIHMSVEQTALTIALGLALCALRSLTGRVWPGMLVHMALNSVTLTLAALGLTAWTATIPLPALVAMFAASCVTSALVLGRDIHGKAEEGSEEVGPEADDLTRAAGEDAGRAQAQPRA